jgi:hypothetical protein
VPIDDSRKLFFLYRPKTDGRSLERALNLHPHQRSYGILNLIKIVYREGAEKLEYEL